MTTEDGISSTESVLEIFNVQPEDSGEYLCTARYGHCLESGTSAIMLTVVSPPELGVFSTYNFIIVIQLYPENVPLPPGILYS